MDKFRVRRSELTTPGHSLKMMEKAAMSQADLVMLDLEDACAVSQKIPARKAVIEALTTFDWGNKIRCFRPNNIRTKYCYSDIIEVVEAAGHCLDVIIIPKVYGPEDVHFIDVLLTQIELNIGLRNRIGLEILIETAPAMMKAYEIARVSERIEALIFGIADYAAEMHARVIAEDQFQIFHYPKSHTIAAARAAGVDVIDNVTLQIRDLDQCRKDATMAAKMGFDGKWAIYPPQIPIINEVFTPSDEQIQKSIHIITEYRKADVERGLGAIVIDDEMVDEATVKVELKKLKIARRAGLVPAMPEIGLE